MTMMTQNFSEMTIEHLGNEATEADLIQFLAICRDVQARHPEMTEEEITDAVYGTNGGDWIKNAARIA